MSLSTNLISGLSSGFDWRTMIDQLMAVEHRSVDLIEDQKTDYESQLSEWQSFNTKLLSLKTTAQTLADPDDFFLYTAGMTSSSATVDASDLLSVSTTSSASKGSYSIKVTSLATAQKLSSASFTSYSDALGDSYEGDVLINGTVVNISASDDLADIRDRINSANTGENPSDVSASIVTYSANDYRLVLTSESTGAEGISMLNGGSTNIVGNLGFTETATGSYDVKNAITSGAQSDRFTSTSSAIDSLLNLSSAQSSAILTIKDSGGTDSNSISIDLANDDLDAIATAINNNKGSANISASVVSETVDGTTYYRLQVDGINASDPFSDNNNVFETLGLIKGGVGDVVGDTGTNAMTTDGQVISTSTLLVDIDGYIGYTAGDQIDFSGFSASGGAVSATFNINAGSTLEDLLTSIESNYGDVSASITSDGKIQITDNTQDTAASSSLSVTFSDTITNGALDFGFSGASIATIRGRELIAGSDAGVIVDGVTVTSSDNTVEDVIPGVTLNLLSEDPGDTTITLNIDRDIDGIVQNISNFVDSYNEIAKYIYQQKAYDEENESTGGILFGDSTLSSVKSDLTSVLVEKVWGVSSDFSSLGLVGITLDGQVDPDVLSSKVMLSIDSSILQGYLETNPNDVKNLFTANGTVDSGALEYISYSQDTQEGEYTVNISTVATQSASTSDSGTIAIDETLTISEGDSTADIELTAGMTLTQIKNAINSELSNVYTETLVGDQLLYEGAGQTTAMSSTTTWDDVYVGAASAGLQNGDEISFTGTTRSGGSVSGSYRISDASADKVEDLLAGIESAYGGKVIASIDSSGRIVVTDKNSGNSQLTIEFDYTNAHSLTFGASVSTTNTGGQEGRYAMEIAATDNGSNIILTHDNYGSNYNFTLSETQDQLWTTGDQTVNNGVHVAGTINGEAATGSGQILTGNDDENHIDGLMIKYTGSSTGDVGDVKFTTGVAELFDRSLYSITDQQDGYVAFKQDSLEDNIDRMEDQVEEMEARLDRKMEMMINKFVAMETALARIQSMSSWISSQIGTLNSFWS